MGRSSLDLAGDDALLEPRDRGQLVYWWIGTRIRQDILKERRAEHGAEIVATLSRQLVPDFGRGFEEKNLRRMVQFAEVFSDPAIVAARRR